MTDFETTRDDHRRQRSRPSLTSGAAFVGVAYAFVVVMMGTTMPAPEYALYEADFGFSEFVITVIFAVYALGVLGALLAFGRWSDAVGRRPMLLAAITVGVLSAAVFVFADSLAALLLGRVLSGISAGIFVGTATVTLLEIAPGRWRNRAPAVATAANIGGLGLGPLMAGFLVQYLPDPTRVTYIVHACLLAVQLSRCCVRRKQSMWCPVLARDCSGCLCRHRYVVTSFELRWPVLPGFR
ncbi:MFS transporter [Rhodococcus sovatensis]|uniref:MFS transporter n=1 Tax=Rhodococcus sovatensis TaxID=1805840 RepID=A0ABZ2PKZ4_9NOCA